MSTVSEVKKLADSFQRLWSHVSSYEFSSNERETTAKMGFKMLFSEGVSNNAQAITAIYPGLIKEFTFGFQTIKRRLALQHPDFPALYANEIRGVAKGSTSSHHEKWLEIEVGFKSLPFPTDGGRPYMKLTRRGYVTEQPIDPNGVLVGGNRVNYNITETIPGCSYMITVYQSQIEDNQFASMIEWQNSLNDTDFLGLGRGQVMFTKVDSDEEIKTDNERSVNYTLQFDTSARDWNYMRSKDGGLDMMLVGGDPRYEYRDLNMLFY